MSFDNYAGLQAEIAKLLNRKDLGAQIPSFIRLFEAQASRRIRHYKMQGRKTFNLDGTDVSLPCNFKGVDAITSGKYDLIYVSPEQFDSILDARSPWNGAPMYYSIIGTKLIFSPGAGDHEGVMRYRCGIPPLSEVDDCNWLLSDSPDVYLYGSALQAAPFMLDDARISMWRSFVEEAYETINADSVKSQLGAHAEVQVRSIA